MTRASGQLNTAKGKLSATEEELEKAESDLQEARRTPGVAANVSQLNTNVSSRKQQRDQAQKGVEGLQSHQAEAGRYFAKYLKDVLDESQLSSIKSNLSEGEFNKIFSKLSKEDIKDKGEAGKIGRSLGITSGFDLEAKRVGESIEGFRKRIDEFTDFLKTSKDEFSRKASAATFKGPNGEGVLKAMQKVMKSSEIMKIADNDKQTKKAMAEASRETVRQLQNVYNDDSRKARALHVNLTSGEEVNVAYDFGDSKAKGLLEEAIKRGDVKGKSFEDFDANDPKFAGFIKEVSNYLAEKLPVREIKAIAREGNYSLFYTIKEIARVKSGQPPTTPGAVDYKKIFKDLERIESYN